MNPLIALATGRRILGQLRHDPRTLVLLIAVPSVLMVLLRWVFAGRTAVFAVSAGPLLAIFPFIVMFVVTSVATLRERTTGTLERLLTMPMAKIDLLAGYALAFGLIAVVQVALAAGLTLGPLGLHVAGSPLLVVALAVLDALLGMALGLFVSAFATTEFQAVQFMPAFVLPQFLLCGLFVPREDMATALTWLSNVLPLSYAVDAMRRVTVESHVTGLLVRDLLVIAGVAIGALILGAATLRRRTP